MKFPKKKDSGDIFPSWETSLCWELISLPKVVVLFVTLYLS